VGAAYCKRSTVVALVSLCRAVGGKPRDFSRRMAYCSREQEERVSVTWSRAPRPSRNTTPSTFREGTLVSPGRIGGGHNRSVYVYALS